MNRAALLIATAAFAAAGAAEAADAPVYSPVVAPAPVAQPLMTWTGPYIGVHAGYGGGDFDYPFAITGLLSGELETNASGFFGGAQIGYNWQASPAWVIGAEADFSWADIEDEISVSLAGGGGFAVTGSAGTSINYFGTIRARAGYLVSPAALLYVTGGAAYGEKESGLALAATGLGAFGASTSETDWGWTVGAGLEYKVTESLSFKTEYLYVDLGENNLINAQLAPGVAATLDLDAPFHTIRAGLNYQFNM